MITFEEFFLKKKIDLDLFQSSKPELLSEFKTHFEQMNEKSFDHTKKYWFNDLRHQFPLSEEKENSLKETFKPKESLPANSIEKGDQNISEAPQPSGFKPRFRAVNIPDKQPEEEKIPDSIKEETEVKKPAGFKPRFKAGTISQKDTKTEEEKLTVKEDMNKEAAEVKKPAGFKPRFKPGLTNKNKED